jgi:hypothetical protein
VLIRALHDAKKLRINRATERVLINCYCPFRADRFHMAKLPASQNTNRITGTSIHPEFNALALTNILFSFDDLNHDGTPDRDDERRSARYQIKVNIL